MSKRLQDVLSSEEKWGNGYYDINSEGEYVFPNTDAACKFCLDGAICNACGVFSIYEDSEKYEEDMDIRSKVSSVILYKYNIYSIWEFNDSKNTTFYMVLDICKEVDKLRGL